MIDLLTPDQTTIAETGLNVKPSTFNNNLAISVHNVSKMYPLYAQPSDRLKQSLWYALPQFLRGKPRQFYREFWALHDVSFEVKRGEALGIIGRNGSGKSTLLQIIAGTLTPTTGEVQVNGRVAALLELGSGFNPEFTGRENVYLNGSILGFSREEMDTLFDKIAAFADIGQFMDQPVKFYSSGMFVRLAFAVHIWLAEPMPEIQPRQSGACLTLARRLPGRNKRVLAFPKAMRAR
jgi:lipopolysaccharide transport system ATP-binding protein